jgi:hypothetical protein
MNLRPLVLGVSLLAGTAPMVAFAQQTTPQQFDESDLGFTPAQMADFAGQPNVVYATTPVQPALIPSQQSYDPAQLGRPDLNQPQTLMMGYQAPTAGTPPSAQQLQPVNPQQMIAPNWPNANIPQPMMPGPPVDSGYGYAYGPGPPAVDGLVPGAPPGVDPYGGTAANGLAGGAASTRPSWYLRGDSIWMQRSRPDDHNLTSYLNLNNGTDHLNGHFLLNTDDVTYPLEPGTRVTLGRYVTDTTMIEATYLGGLNWDRRNGTPDFATGANGVGPLLAYWSPGFGPFETSAFTGSNLQIASYESQFNSFELGVRHAVWGTTSILAGFRYINVGDLFQLAAFDDAANTNPNGNGFYRTWTNNNLVGLQIGSEYTHDLWFPRLFASIDARGGLFANFAEQKNLLFNSGDTYDQRSDRQVQFASVWDVTLAISYLATDHLTIRGGYTFLYMNGLALAPNQMDTNPTMQNSRSFIADNDSLTLQGPFIGGELAW